MRPLDGVAPEQGALWLTLPALSWSALELEVVGLQRLRVA